MAEKTEMPSGLQPAVAPGRAGMDEKQRRMTTDNLCLVRRALARIRPDEAVVGMERDDLYQTGCLALCEAALSYQGRGPFHAFASTVIRNRLLDACRKAGREKRNRYYPEADFFWESEDLLDRRAEEQLRDVEARCLFTSLYRRQKGSSRKGMRILGKQAAGYSLREAAVSEGIRPETAYKRKRRAREVLKQELRRTADYQ